MMWPEIVRFAGYYQSEPDNSKQLFLMYPVLKFITTIILFTISGTVTSASMMDDFIDP